MARTVADAALLAGVMVGLHPSDHATIDSTGFLDGFDPTSTEAADRLRGRRVGLCLRLGDFPVGEDILANTRTVASRSEEHTSELQSRFDLVCRLLLEKKKNINVMTRSRAV